VIWLLAVHWLSPHILVLAGQKARNKLDLSAENIRPQTTNRASKPKPKTPAKSNVHDKQAKAGHGYLAQSYAKMSSLPTPSYSNMQRWQRAILKKLTQKENNWPMLK